MPVTRHLGLGVIETRWFGEHHHTVRPLFEFLSYALKNRPDAFTYERFVGATSFREAVRFMTASGDVDYLLRVVVPDIAAYDAFYKRLIARIEIRDVSSSFAMEQIKYTTELPLDYMMVDSKSADD